MHDIRYDEMHDEFFVVNPFAEAILTFRGGTSGQESPIRIIQGPHVKIGGNRLDVDPIHDEIVVNSPLTQAILTFRGSVNGEEPPIRLIQGPKTKILGADTGALNTVTADPEHNEIFLPNILVVGFNKGEQDRENGALLIFNRTDSGNVKPRAIIRGPKSGIIRINQMAVYPPKKLIVATMPGLVDQMEPPDAFLGIWTYDDNGDVPPKWKIPIGSKTTLRKPFGVVLNPKNKEVILSDMRLNSVLTFAVPEIF